MGLQSEGTAKTTASKKDIVIPGDKISAIEEFEPGLGAMVVSDSVVATTIGTPVREMPDRKIVVKPLKTTLAKLPEVGDYILGNVQSAASSVAQVRIDAINDVPSTKELSGMLSLRDDRRRRSPPLKPGDTIRARVVSTMNSIYHLGLDGKECGVLHTTCSVCGGRVIQISRDRIKCTDCGSVDERQLAEDFAAISKLEAQSQ
jgi:exosome complex RNA-binding protein Csl4